MALVNFLKFNTDIGAIISDEEFWNVHFRKRMHNDNLHPLIDPATASKWGMQVVYGGVGYPSVHKETLINTQKQLNILNKNADAHPPERVKDVARIAFEQMQGAIRKRIDQKMRFYYGFATEDLHRGYFEEDGKKILIQAESIKENAKKLSERDQKDALLKAALESKAAVFGFDREGVTGYYLSAEGSILGYVHEGFEAIGAGKYASGLVFGSDFKAKTLNMRKEGYDPAEGMVELIDSAFLAGEHFKEVGGNYQIVIINRNGTDFTEQYKEIFDDTARLAAEIVRAMRADYICREKAILLIQRLIFENEPFDVVEHEFFECAKSKAGLALILRKYKLNEVERIVKTGESKAIFMDTMLRRSNS